MPAHAWTQHRWGHILHKEEEQKTLHSPLLKMGGSICAAEQAGKLQTWPVGHPWLCCSQSTAARWH